MTITIEFFGIPRLRAERAELIVQANTLRNVLRLVENACPKLRVLSETGDLLAHYRISLDGQRFLTDLEETLSSGSRLLLLSADVGG